LSGGYREKLTETLWELRGIEENGTGPVNNNVKVTFLHNVTLLAAASLFQSEKKRQTGIAYQANKPATRLAANATAIPWRAPAV
jgi:hypothetical protein